MGITSLSPNNGPISGGTPITISGIGFVNGMRVSIGGYSATNIVVTSTTITAITPLGTFGAKDVTVGDFILVNGFTYTSFSCPSIAGALSITNIHPPYGPTFGGTPITICGRGFSNILYVTIGGYSITNITISNTNTITGITPIGSTGNAIVTISTTTGSVSSTFQYVTPIITAVEPPSGPIIGGTPITITGTNIAQVGNSIKPGALTIGGTTVPFTITNDIISAITPEGTGSAAVVLKWSSTNTATSSFMYVSPPTITSVSPNSGIISGGTPITITGTNFIQFTNIPFANPLNNIVNVFINGFPATSVVINNLYTIITAVTPAGTNGVKTLTIMTSGGGVNTSFTYFTPTISYISPNRGPITGGTLVTMTGINLLGVLSITNASIVSVNNTNITATMSAGTGTITITVTWAVGVSSSIPYTYSDTPLITLVKPNGGPVGGGTIITITGTSFIGSTVTIGGNPATNVSIINNSIITATTPKGVFGRQVVVITNTGGQKAYSFFTYNPPPPAPPFSERECPGPPYNATNFTSGPILSTLQSYARNSPIYPWDTGTDSQQVYKSQQNFSLFNTINQQTHAVKKENNVRIASNLPGNIPYPQFTSQAERLMYTQGQVLTAARNKITGQNPSKPMGVPCSTIYNIIYSPDNNL